MKNLQALIDGRAPLHKNAHVDTKGHFKDKGYKEIFPNQTEDAPRELLRAFYEHGDMFFLTDHTLKQQRTVYKVDEKFEIQFAATFFIIKLEQYLVSYLDVIKAKVPKQGFGSRFVADLVEFLEVELEKDTKLKGAHLFVGQSQLLEPHAFFRRHQFGPLPQQFEQLKLEGSDLAYRKLEKRLEEEKESVEKRGKKRIEKFDDGKSMVSTHTQMTNKASNGTLKRHCQVCDKLITNWADHRKKVHNGEDVPYEKCVLGCLRGESVEQKEKSEVGAKSCHQSHKMLSCGRCSVQREVRNMKEGLCIGCFKGKPMTFVSVPTPNFLDSSALARLSNQIQDIKPADSFSVVGDKRRHELMVQESAYYHQEDTQSEAEFNEEPKHEHPEKRPKAREVWTTNSTPFQTLHTASVVYVTQTDAEVIEQLKEIEFNALPQVLLALKLQSVCHMLPQESVTNFLMTRECPIVTSLLPLVFACTDQLSTHQRAGLLFASLLNKGKHWQNATNMLTTMTNNDRDGCLDLFELFAGRIYDKDTTRLLKQNWQALRLWHFDLVEQIKTLTSSNKGKMLQLGLCVEPVEIPLFIDFANSFAKTPCSSLICDHSETAHIQPLQFGELMSLAYTLMLKTNAPVVAKCRVELMKIPLSNWAELLEKTASTVHLSDKGSVQEAIDEFARAYGAVREPFSVNLFSSASPLGLILHETQNKANFKQLGLAHFCVGTLQKVERQLWCVPSGDGKSRIMAFTCLLALKTGMFKKVHMIYDNKHLMERDQADFQDLWRLAECQDMVGHHIGYDFQPEDNSLILIDESDRTTFEAPRAFATFINQKFCVCFTATPSNCDEGGVEVEVIKALGFTQYEYIIAQTFTTIASRLRFDEVSQASTLEEKASVIGALLQQGSVLVYAPAQLTSTLKSQFVDLVMVDDTTDSSMLRQLDKGPHRLLVALDSFGMRGIDYRSKSNPLYLVVAQQFSCTREALQGVMRVGRFGDPCKRIKFADCQQLVDPQSQLQHNIRLLKFIEEVKIKVQVKAAQTKKASPKKAIARVSESLALKHKPSAIAARQVSAANNQASLFGYLKPKQQ